MPKSQLKQTLTMWQLTFFGVGTMIGAGIYVLVGKVAGIAGMAAPLAFVLSGVLAGFTACSYAELSARIPRSAGAVVYVQAGMGRPWLSTVVGWLVITSGVISAASILNGFVGYVDVFVEIPHWITITVVTLLLTGVALYGIGESVGLIVGITLLEIGGLIFVVVMTADSFGDLPARADELVPEIDVGTFGMLMSAAFLAFFAFVGFEDLANLAEEARNPVRDLPKAVLLAMGITTVLYILIALVAVLSLPADQLAASDAPLADILALKGESLPLFISAISLVAVINGALAQMIMGSRVVFGMSENGLAPKLFSYVIPSRKTPLPATLVVAFIIWLLAVAFPIITLAKATSFVILIVFTMVNLSLFLLKIRGPHPQGVVRYPLWFPVLGFVLCLAFLIWQTVAYLS
jgi:APA family basic amino acid/polyamine antiporter